LLQFRLQVQSISMAILCAIVAAAALPVLSSAWHLPAAAPLARLRVPSPRAGGQLLPHSSPRRLSRRPAGVRGLAAQAGPQFSFDILDADGDGSITRAEYEAAFTVYIQEQPWLAAHQALRCMLKYETFVITPQALDVNKDGKISEAEFNSISRAPFKMLDRDGGRNAQKLAFL